MMQQSERNCKFNEWPNCSIVRIVDNEVYVFDKHLYNQTPVDIDYTKGLVHFYVHADGYENSINQSVDGIAKPELLSLRLNTAFDVFKAFEEVDRENERRVSSLFEH